MTVYVAWTTGWPDARELVGPWREVWAAGDDLLLVDSDDTLSRVYHELKWSLPDGAPLLVVPADGPPKLKGLRAGTTTWVRERGR